MRLNFQASPCTTRIALGHGQRLALPEGSTAAVSSTIHTQPLPRHATLRGFTLVELIIVIGLLAFLAVGALVAYDGVGEDAKQQIVRTEMASISKALKQYRRDVGAYPARQHPADFNFLFQAQEWDAGTNAYVNINEWDIETARGWRGPYLDNAGNGFVTVGDTLTEEGKGSPEAVNELRVYSVGDPFNRAPMVVSNVDKWYVWSPCLVASACKTFENGRPYYLFDLEDSNKARLVSSGHNGQLESTLAPSESISNCNEMFASGRDTGDDIILCLQ